MLLCQLFLFEGSISRNWCRTEDLPPVIVRRHFILFIWCRLSEINWVKQIKMTEPSSSYSLPSKKRQRSPDDNEHSLDRDQICSSLGALLSFSSLVSETLIFNSFPDAEDNLTFNDTMIALRLMRTQFPKLDKVFCVPWKYNFQSSKIFDQQKHVSVYWFICSAIPINFVQYMECCWGVSVVVWVKNMFCFIYFWTWNAL
jgi:hypothetical protein